MTLRVTNSSEPARIGLARVRAALRPRNRAAKAGLRSPHAGGQRRCQVHRRRRQPRPGPPHRALSRPLRRTAGRRHGRHGCARPARGRRARPGAPLSASRIGGLPRDAPTFTALLDMFHGLCRYLADDDDTVRLDGSPLFTFSDGEKDLLSESTTHAFTWPTETPAHLLAHTYDRARYTLLRRRPHGRRDGPGLDPVPRRAHHRPGHWRSPDGPPVDPSPYRWSDARWSPPGHRRRARLPWRRLGPLLPVLPSAGRGVRRCSVSASRPMCKPATDRAVGFCRPGPWTPGTGYASHECLRGRVSVVPAPTEADAVQTCAIPPLLGIIKRHAGLWRATDLDLLSPEAAKSVRTSTPRGVCSTSPCAPGFETVT